MDPLKILAFAVYFFLALNISTIIVVQYAIPMKYAWAIYLGTMFIATLPCVYLVEGTTVADIVLGVVGGTAAIATLPVAAVAVGTGAVVAGTGAVAETGLVATAGGMGLVGSLLASSNFAKYGMISPGIMRGTTTSSPATDWEKLHSGGRRYKRGGGLFAIPLF
jgi:hypothetical protein